MGLASPIFQLKACIVREFGGGQSFKLCFLCCCGVCVFLVPPFCCGCVSRVLEVLSKGDGHAHVRMGVWVCGWVGGCGWMCAWVGVRVPV